MQVEQINSIFREIFNELINDGYKKSNVCSITLGSSNVPQFDSFIKGTDFGIKPLQRIIENQGFNFKIIISPKESPEISKFVDDVNVESLKDIKSIMLKTLDNENSIKLASIPKTGIIAGVTNDIFEEITK
jgi:hypothetical protein